MPQTKLGPKREAVLQAVLEHVERNEPLLVLKAPPGSGKTFVTVHAVALAAFRKRRIAVATQTNAQADDFCRRMAQDFGRFAIQRWASSALTAHPLGDSVSWIYRGNELPSGPCVVVSTSAKWAIADLDGHEPFDVMFIDEAWQMCWADFMLMSAVAPRFVLVGDPGQIPPVIPIDVSRWQTSRRPPHVPAPEVILRDRTLPTRAVELPVSTRLPHDTCELVRAFYDFHFDSWSAPGERRLVLPPPPAPGDGVDQALHLLTTGSVALLTLPTPAAGPPLEEDRELAHAAAEAVRRLLARQASVITEDGPSALLPSEIGLAATHRVMNTRLREELGDLAAQVRVDTPERWQGLERKVMVVIHPLSGVIHPSPFDLSTGRLCVMASRHNIGLLIVSRDHVGHTLNEYLPIADQAVGLPDEAGRGRAHREMTEAQVEFLANIVRLYRGQPPENLHESQEFMGQHFPTGKYRDVAGLCKLASRQEIEAQGWSLNPGRYVGVTEKAADDFDFKVRLAELNEELKLLNAEARSLEAKIAGNVAALLS